jgi:flagellar motor switch/type III secretory pathway protein FliN
VDLEQVTLLSEGKTIAEGSLVNVDEEIAIQIKKVN